jgi:autotransporter-associated beta strand protein
MRSFVVFLLVCGLGGAALGQTVWEGYAGNPQHTALSAIASQPMQAVHWTTPVDLDPQFSNGVLYTHYGSPMITSDNTVIVPVKTGAWGGFELNAYNGATGTELWTQTADYTLPPANNGAESYDWTPPYSPAISGGTVYYPGNGGTIYERSSLDSPGSVTPTQVAFYPGGLATYEASAAAYNADVAISTPITADAQGDIYFGYTTVGTGPGGITSGIARISSTGVGTFFEADQLMAGGSNAGMNQVATNCAPALSNNGSTVYVAMSSGEYGEGRMVALSAATLTPENSVLMMDPETNTPSEMINDSTSSPLVGPDGDVYYGVIGNEGTSRGWMEHYSADLTQTKTPGGFGWDDTASIVPASMVPSYHGTSSYLIMTKYNEYAGYGGTTGQNMLAILDPNATETNELPNTSGTTQMKEVETVLGPTLDLPEQAKYPGAVHEWCDNSAVVDPATDSILVNSEDGNVYRWNLLSNSLTETVKITNGLGEAYTPTEIGPDGTVYAINNATLWAVGATPSANVYTTWTGSGSGNWSDGSNWSGGVPTIAGDVATFDTSISGASTISLGTNWTVGTMNFYSSASYNLAPGTGGSLTLNNGSSAALINVEYGNHTISAPVSLASNVTIAVGQANNVLTISGNISGPGGITLGATATALSAGTVVLSGSNNYGGGTTVEGGTLVVAANGALADGNVTISGGTLQLATNTGLAQMAGLSITGNGTLDIGNNRIIIDYTPGDDPIASIASWIRNGYYGLSGPSIMSSDIASDDVVSGFLYGIGYADGADGEVAGLPSGEIEIMFTLLGDANLDGTVNNEDFAPFSHNLGQVGVMWDDGDFNYDGTVNNEDFAPFSHNLGQFAVLADLAGVLDAANGIGLADVPEPGMAGILLVVGLGVIGWRGKGRICGAAHRR